MTRLRSSWSCCRRTWSPPARRSTATATCPPPPSGAHPAAAAGAAAVALLVRVVVGSVCSTDVKYRRRGACAGNGTFAAGPCRLQQLLCFRSPSAPCVGHPLTLYTSPAPQSMAAGMCCRTSRPSAACGAASASGRLPLAAVSQPPAQLRFGNPPPSPDAVPSF